MLLRERNGEFLRAFLKVKAEEVFRETLFLTIFTQL
jgi:hypothetical protein